MFRKFINTLSFLTILPLPKSLIRMDDFKAYYSFFPVIGIIVGVIAAICGYFMGLLFPPFLASVMAIVIIIKITGAIHLDGLADTADGFLSARPKEKILEIMKDSRIGVMGAVILISVIIIDMTALSSSGQYFTLSLLFAPFCARIGVAFIPLLIGCARPGGLGDTLCVKAGLTTCLLWACVCSLVSYMVGGSRLLLATLVVYLINIIIAFYARRKIGGYTGDVLGAAVEIGQMWFFLVCATRINY